MTVTTRHMRIAMMLGSDGPGGAEMVVLRLSSELRARGHAVVPVLLHGGLGWLGARYRDAGFDPQMVHLGRSWIDFACVRELHALFRAQSIDVVHSHEFDMAVYGAAAAKRARVPHVVTMHGGITVTKSLKRRIALRWAMRRSDATVVVSAATQRQFAGELGLATQAFRVVHNGVPVVAGDATRVRREFNCSDADVVILAVGTLERNKGHHILLEALAGLGGAARSVPWKLIIAGGRGGDQQQPLLEYVRAHGLEGRVHIVTGRGDIADLQALASVFAMPSLWEGLPMAVLEAMVAGNAIVASATGGIPEAIVDGRDGLLVPPGDVGRLSDALGALLADPQRRTQLGTAARARAQREFVASVMAERYESLYEQALSRSTER